MSILFIRQASTFVTGVLWPRLKNNAEERRFALTHGAKILTSIIENAGGVKNALLAIHALSKDQKKITTLIAEGERQFHE